VQEELGLLETQLILESWAGIDIAKIDIHLPDEVTGSLHQGAIATLALFEIALGSLSLGHFGLQSLDPHADTTASPGKQSEEKEAGGQEQAKDDPEGQVPGGPNAERITEPWAESSATVPGLYFELEGARRQTQELALRMGGPGSPSRLQAYQARAEADLVL